MIYKKYFEYISFFKNINNFEYIIKENEIFKVVNLTEEEIKAISLKDIKGYSSKKCSKEMDMNLKDFEALIYSARKKIAIAISQGTSIKVNIEEKHEEIEESIDDCWKFRCAICGYIYYVNYENGSIVCPKCNSNKVMTSEEAGFTKKWFNKK